MPHFLHVSSYAPPHGGAAQVMAEQAKAQRRFYDDKVTLISFESGFDPLKKLGISVEKFKGRVVGQDWLPSIPELRRLWRLVRQADYIILHSPYYAVNCWVALMGKWQRKKMVCLHHGHLPSEFRNKINIAFMNRLIRAWLILDASHQDYLAQYVRRLKPTFKIENGVWLQELQKNIVKKNTNKCQHFVFCGRVVEEKGVRELQQAIQTYPKFEFTIIGDGDQKSLFSNLSNVKVKGFLPYDQAMQAIGKADCLILPSYSETFPMVVIEALAMRVPVIVSDINETIRRLVRGNGLLIEPKNSQALIEAIQQAHKEGLSVTKTQQIDILDWSKVITNIRSTIMNLS